MNHRRNHVRRAGAAIVLAAVAFTATACGGSSKDAAKSGSSGGTADNTIRGLVGVPAQTAAVRVGNFCSDIGAVAQTKDGKAATCAQKSGESKARWTEQTTSKSPTVTGAAASVRVGNFCSDVGAIGQTKDGKPATCTQKAGESRSRWAEAKAGTTTIPGTVHPGAFCAPQGAKGKSAKGASYTCTKKSNQKQAHWTQ